MEALYKRKGKVGLGNREKRKEFNKQFSKDRRDEIVASRRRMPLGELNVSCTSKSPLMKPPRSEIKKGDRLQQLREWQQARKEAKHKVPPKKAIFVVGKPKDINFRPQIKVGIKRPHGAVISAAKKAILNLSPSKKPLRPLPISTSTHRASLPPSSKQPQHPVMNNKIEKAANKRMPAKQTASHAESPKGRSLRNKTKALTSANKHVTGPSQVTSKVTSNYRKTGSYNNSCKSVTSKKIAPAPRIAVGSRAASASRVAPKAGKCTSMRVGNKQSKKRATPAGTKPQEPDEMVNPCESPAITKEYVPPPSSSQALCVETEEDDSLVISIPPTTPIKKNYAPVCPSPLLHSHSADHEQHQKTCNGRHPTFVNEPAWIPGASAPMETDSDNFGDFDNKFSPFKFGTTAAGSTPFHFSFAMDDGLSSKPVACRLSVSDMNCSSEVTSTTTNATGEDTSEGEYCVLVEADEIMITSTTEAGDESKDDKAEEIENTPSKVHSARKRGTKSRSSAKRRLSCILVVNEEETKSVVENLATALEEESFKEEEQMTGGLDIFYFRKLHSDVCHKLTPLCDMWEEKTGALERSNEPDMEEVLGQLRTTTGQARLLMRQKLKQYIGLVDTAEKAPSGEGRKTSADDLQGFWDMVYFQVQGLYKMFDDNGELERNGWRLPFPSPKKPKLPKQKSGVNRTIKRKENESANEHLLAARKKREEGRARLKQMKAKNRQANAEEIGKENQLQPFRDEESPKKRAFEECECVMLSPLRRSLRIKNRSVFSPMYKSTDDQIGACGTPKRLREKDRNDIATGVLLEL